MLWASERRRQLRFAIAFRCIQLGLDEKKTSGEVGASEVGVFEFGPDEVGSSQILLLASDFGSHEFACAQKQGIDVSSMCCHIQFHKSIRAVVRKTFGL